jgi:co-chaperonin GroES (HSP10)
MKPFNRHLLVQPIEEEQEEQQSVIVLPSDYEKPVSPYLTAEVLAHSEDCAQDLTRGDIVVVERRMIHTIEIYNKTYYLVLENYIFGRLDSDEIKQK